MAVRKRKGAGENKRWNYFYLNGELHKTLTVKRSDNLIVTWNYNQHKRVAYGMIDAYSRRQRAYTTGQLAKLLGRELGTIRKHLMAGYIRKPQAAYTFDEAETVIRYMFSEDDVREAYDYFKTVHIGRPRVDGEINNSDLVSKPELEALMRNEKVLYTKADDGTYVPVWKQPEW